MNNLSSYHCEFSIIPNHEHDFMYEKRARQIVSKLKTLIHKLICVKNSVYPESTKNSNGAIAMSKKIVCLCVCSSGHRVP